MGGLTLLLVRGWQRTREVELVTVPVEGELANVLERRLDHFYFGFAHFFRHLAHYFYYYALVLANYLAGWSKYLLHKVEKRSSYLIDSVHGKGVLNKKGSVSLFLTQIKPSRTK